VLRTVANFYGGAIGIDGLIRPDLRLGGFVGGGATNLAIDLNSGSATSDIVFAGAYGRYAFGRAFLDFGLLGGESRTSTTRNITTNLAGLQTAKASFDGWFISPEIAYGYGYGLGSNLTLTPAARLRYVVAQFDGFSETGSSANLTVGSRTLQNIEERGDLTLTQTTNFASADQLRTSVHAGVLGLQRVGDGGVNAILLGQALAFATPGSSSVGGVYAGGGFEWRTAQRIDFFAAGEYTAMSDASRTVTAKGGVRVGF
jgi:Autotransporter beta-domain